MKGLKLFVLIFVFSQTLFSQIGNTNKRNCGDRNPLPNFRKDTHIPRPRFGNNEINFKLDENKIHIGVIPYFLLSRSYGAYASFPLSKIISAEYRFSYTFSTNYRSYYFFPTEDLFYFKGQNHFAMLNFRYNEERSIALIGGYRNWFYNNKSYREYFINVVDPYEIRSSKMNGFCVGLELIRKFDLEKIDLKLFYNVIYTHFSVKRTILDIEPDYYGKNYNFPIHKNFQKDKLNFSLGFKIGINIKKA